MDQYRGTTILSVRRNGVVAIGGDGQVSMGNTVMKSNARKVRRLFRGEVIAGFAGGTADAFTLFELFAYLGWIKVAESLLNPFGDDDEDFQLNYLIDRNISVSKKTSTFDN